MAKNVETTIDELIGIVRSYDPKADFGLILKAYKFANKVHGNQKRLEGYDFISHLLNTARVVAERHMDVQSICAALLHDTVEDADISMDIIKKEFGDEIASLIEPLTKLEKVRFESFDEYNAENLRKILLATSRDVRVMIIKLADRLDNMRSLGVFREEKQRRIAQETLDIYAPIAEKLGMWSVKGELEDRALRYINPEVYKMLKDKINERRDEREEYTAKVLRDIEQKLKQISINAKVSGRAKYFYSIYQKMIKKHKTIDEMHDLIALRIIVNTIPECYAALLLIQKMYDPLKNRLKDYIKNPKANGYQSLHIDVMTHEQKVLEIQIRTVEMHHQAEEGIAAHWRYKETERDKEFDRKLSWLKQILDWKQHAKGKEFVDDLKIDIFKNEIIALTPKGDPIILPDGSTPVDFAYAVHTLVGNQCSKAEVNGKMVPLDYILKSGDVVKIITQKNMSPNRAWLSFVKTSKAKSKIKNILEMHIDKDPKYLRGLERRDINLLNFIEYTGKRPMKLSKCCNPQYLDPIVAFYTKDDTLTIHKSNCPNIANFDASKKENVLWKKEDASIKELVVVVKDKIGLLSQLLNISLETNVQVLSINVKTRKEFLKIHLKIKADDEKNIENFMARINKIEGVSDQKLVEKSFFPFFGVFK